MNQNDQSGYVHWYITYLPVDQGQTAQKRGIPSCCLSPCLPRSVFQWRRKWHDSSGCSFLTSPYKRHAGINTRACLKLLLLFPASYFTASKALPVSVSPWFSRDSPLSRVLRLSVVPRLQYPRGCSHLVHCWNHNRSYLQVTLHQQATTQRGVLKSTPFIIYTSRGYMQYKNQEFG